MRYLVTGGLGVVGSICTERLIKAGHSVEIIDACEEPRNEWMAERLKALGAFVIPERLEETNPDNIEAALTDANAVIHAAAHTGIPHSVIHPDDDWRSNVDATRVLLEALRRCPKPTVVLSSVKPYDTSRMPLDESCELVPDEPYAASKAAQSMLAMAYARSYDLPIVTFRCSNLYGPAPCHGPRHGWFTWFCISAAIGRPLEVQGDGEQTRDMLHASDVLSACMAAFKDMKQIKGRVFNLGGGDKNRTSVSAIARNLRHLTGVEIHNAPARAMDDKHVWTSTAAFRRSTGWLPMVGVDAGLVDVLGWAQANADVLRKLYEDVA